MIFILLASIGFNVTADNVAEYRKYLGQQCAKYDKMACVQKQRLEQVFQDVYLYKLNQKEGNIK